MSSNWHAANQQYLLAAVDVVRAVLEWEAAQKAGTEITDQRRVTRERLQAVRDMMPAPAALDRLCAMFGLSAFEQHLLLLCVGMELDADFSFLCAATQGDERRNYPTFHLARTIFGGHWDAFSPAGPLRHWKLIEIGSGQTLTERPLRIDERILHYLNGVNHLDERLLGIVEVLPLASFSPSQSMSRETRDWEGVVPGMGNLSASHQALAERVTTLWAQRAGESRLPVVQWCGAEISDKRAIARAVSALLGLDLHICCGYHLPTSPADLQRLRRLWEREAILSGSVLFLECDEADAHHQKAIRWLIEHMDGPLMVSSQERVPVTQRMMINFEVSKPLPTEQRALWQQALGPLASPLNGSVEQLVSQFNLSGPAIRAVCTSGLASVGPSLNQGAENETLYNELEGTLWEACRTQARPRLDDLAQRIIPSADWHGLVLPALQRQLLRDMISHVRQRQKVYETWGFANKSGRGLGISALFAGASGTGKTMAAEVLANELRLDLYRIDLSAVVSKYIGETEKNLRRIFDAAEAGGVILLFDEADALFGKRSEVKDSHDRHANIEVSYLLQRMEAYRGLAILTSNIKSALDTAFLRRIRFIVQFPFPNAAQRAQIWQRIFPTQTPTEGLDTHKLAQLNIAGGHIRNIAMNAAFLAADANEPVRMSHLLRATRSEYIKLEKQLTKSEIRGW